MSYRQQVAGAFSRSAATYEGAASLQYESGLRLLRLLAMTEVPEGPVVDVGGGSGLMVNALRETLPASSPIVLDLARGMLDEAAKRYTGLSLVQGDFLQQPLKQASCGLLFSNFAMQWASSPQAVVNECRRTLMPGGLLALAVPVAGSLSGIASAWQSVDGNTHINTLAEAVQWREAIQASGMQCLSWQEDVLKEAHQSVRACLQGIQAIGANTLEKRSAGLMGKDRWRRFEAAFRDQSIDGNYVLSYRIVWCIARV